MSVSVCVINDYWPLISAVAKNRQQGAATTINCAVNPELNSRQAFYYEDCRQKQSTAESR